MRERDMKFTVRRAALFFFQHAPWATLAMLLLKGTLAMLPFASVLLGAQFVDRALEAALGVRPAICSAVLVALVQLVQRLGNNGYSFCRMLQRERTYPAVDRMITEKIACLQYSCIEDDAAQDILSRIAGDPEGILSGIMEGYLEMAVFIISNVSLVSILIFQMPVWVSLVITAVLAAFGFYALKSGQRQYHAHAEVTACRRKADYYEKILGDRDTVNERTLFDYGEKINKEFLAASRRARKKEQKARFSWFLGMNIGGYIAAGISVIVLLLLLPAVLRRETSVGLFVSLVTAFMSMIQMVTWQFPDRIKELSKSKMMLEDFNVVMDMPLYADAFQDFAVKKGKALTEGRLDGTASGGELSDGDLTFESLEFRNVTFRYPGTDKEVLKNMSFQVKKGMHYAFAGKNGCGKSTVVKLILRLYEPDKGEILLNHRNIREYEAGHIWKIFAVLFQDYARYPVSLADNIALGGGGGRKSMARVERALSQAGLEQVVEKLPEGLETALGKVLDGSVDLSGGEWQRVAMARMHYNASPVKILDEPTAAMDPVQEQKVYRQFSDAYRDRTTIMITHRLGAAAACDCIFVIEDGGVKETGSHESLMERNGIYREMFDKQREWYI